ncbi:MAG: MaoC family dehydratase N-terminal domain-containing protein [Chloroflexi bacterium]|nr:MaoC family dehydratase N-terminal domain-containing protein [Chloroflexota bacterium]
MVEQDGLEFNREVLNREYPAGTFHVTRELILDFARGIGETNPIYTDEKSAPDGLLFAPPLLVSLFAKFEGPEDLNLRFEGHDYMAGQYIEPLGVVRAGDLLTCTARIKSVYKKTGRSGPMAFVVREHLFVNQRGEKVAVVGMSTVRRK